MAKAPLSPKLFENFHYRGLELNNRIVMAPMSRSQAAMTVPTSEMAEYYGRRATAGLIITEATTPSLNGLTDSYMPGLFLQEHIEGWAQVTKRVHSEGGKIFVQLMHCGRMALPDLQPEDARLMGPSAVAANSQIWIDEEAFPAVVPNAMTSDDIQQAIGEFELAAKMALEAGFDGVEIHAANGYLLDQFLNPISNLRADEWGGSIENLCRFPLAVIEKVASAISEAKVGVRISPFGRYNGMTPNTQYKNLYDYFIQKLNRIDCQYLHIADHPSHRSTPYNLEFLRQLKHDFKNRVIRCGGYRLDSAESEIEIGNADLIAFGRPFISNENLVKKLQNKQDLEPEDFDQYP